MALGSSLQWHLTPVASVSIGFAGGRSETNPFPRVRTEGRSPEEILVELCSLENAAHEMASTVNVSHHGAQVLAQAPWEPNQDVSLRTIFGNRCLRAHIVYCKSLPNRTFSIGLESLQPAEDWLVLTKASDPSQTH